MSNIGDNIRKAREKLGWTQEELAYRMGYKSKSTINKIEMGINDIPQSKIVKYAEVLGVSPGALMGWVDEKTDKKNDDLVKIVALARKDADFFELVSKLADLPAEDYAVIKHLVDSLHNK